MIKDKIIELDINDIKPYKNNPRFNDNAVEYVKNSIAKFDYVQPIVIDKNNEVIIGHTRLAALKELGRTKVEVIKREDLTDEEVKALRIADNKTSEYAEWDIEKLAEELENIDIDMTEFGVEDIEADIETEVIEDNFEVEIPEKPKAQYGDKYQLGEHIVVCGDSTIEADIEKLVGGVEVDLSFTSPPYNVASSIGYEKDSKYENDNDNKEEQEYLKFLVDFTTNSIKKSKYTFVNIQSVANNKIALIDYLYEMKEFYNDTIIWNKGFGQPAMAKNVMNSAYEYIHIFSNKPSRAIGTKEFRGTIPNIVTIDKQTRNNYSDKHNATFSVEFASYFINNFSNKGEVVLDLFGGTGTTLIACEELGRKCLMMEYDPKYVDVIIERWEQFTGKKAIKLN